MNDAIHVQVEVVKLWNLWWGGGGGGGRSEGRQDNRQLACTYMYMTLYLHIYMF